jgi:hypothetical protein
VKPDCEVEMVALWHAVVVLVTEGLPEVLPEGLMLLDLVAVGETLGLIDALPVASELRVVEGQREEVKEAPALRETEAQIEGLGETEREPLALRDLVGDAEVEGEMEEELDPQLVREEVTVTVMLRASEPVVDMEAEGHLEALEHGVGAATYVTWAVAEEEVLSEGKGPVAVGQVDDEMEGEPDKDGVVLGLRVPEPLPDEVARRESETVMLGLSD